MTNKELIEELKTYPEDMEVLAKISIIERPFQYIPNEEYVDFDISKKEGKLILDIDGTYHK